MHISACVLACQEKPPILLYTGHAAKGLEFDVVHIANYSLLPSKRALETGGIKLEQEFKVMFVMLTRTRMTLAFLAEPEGTPFAPTRHGGLRSVTPSLPARAAETQTLEDVLFPEPLVFSPNKRARTAEAVATVVTPATAATLQRSVEVQHGVDEALALLGLEAMPTTLAALQAAVEAALQAAADEVAVKSQIKAAQKMLRRHLLTRANRTNRELVLL